MSEISSEVEIKNPAEMAIDQSNKMYWPARFLVEFKGQVPENKDKVKVYNFSEGDTKLSAWYKAEDATDKAMKGKKIVYSVLLKLAQSMHNDGEILIVPQQADSMIVYPAIARESYYHPPDRLKRPQPEAIVREATLEDIKKYLPALNTALAANHHQEVPILS